MFWDLYLTPCGCSPLWFPIQQSLLAAGAIHRQWQAASAEVTPRSCGSFHTAVPKLGTWELFALAKPTAASAVSFHPVR